MARSKGNLHGLSGIIGRVVIKQYADKTVVTAIPDMSHVKRTKKQKKNASTFAKAVAYAKAIINDPVKKAALAATLPKGASVYHAAIKEYLEQLKS
jgi:hypothetical protein